jgi:PAS domain S-box-containing protein
MASKIIRQFIQNIVTSGRDEIFGIEVKRKTILINIICIIGILNLIPLGILAFIQNNLTLGFFDLIVAAVLITILYCLRITGYHIFFSYFGVSFAGALYVYLFATGGVYNTGHLWMYTFPLFTSFLLGSKRGAIVTSNLFALAILIFLIEDYSPIITTYSKYFKIRFITSFFVVFALSFFYEHIREKTQQQLAQKNVVLEKTIADLRHAEDKQKDTSLLLETVLDSIPDIIGIQDMHHEVIRYNEAGYKFLNISYEDIRGKKCYELIGLNVPCAVCATSEAYRTKKPAIIEKYLEEHGIWLDVRAYPMFDAKGEIKNIVEHLRDITTEKRAEEELQQSEERYRSLVENTMDGYFICDFPSGKFLFLNERFCKIFGYTNQEGIRLTVWDVVSYDEHDLLQKRIEARMDGKGLNVERNTYTAVRKDRSIFRVEISTSLVFFRGSPSVQGIIRDITEQERLEQQLQQLQKMEAIGLLAGGVAHDLNNILSGIVGYPDLILMDLPENSPLQEPILTIKKSGERASTIVQDLLTLARRGVAISEIVNLNHSLSEQLKSPEFLKLLSFYPDIKVETQFEKNLLNIKGSATHLSKSFMNLISNAAEAMPNGGKILISTENRYLDKPIRGYDHVDEGDYVTVTFSDTGIGICKEDMERIFEPFYTKKVMGRSGTGLGMAVVWGTVKDHLGYIDLQSSEGKGTTFTLYFPVTREEIHTEKSLSTIEDYIGKGETILIVDDVKDQRDLASVMLKKLSYSVVAVSSGEKAIDYMKDNSADLLVLDMIMDPGIDGLETYKRIIEIHPSQKAIITSGYSETGRVKEAQRLGVGQYIKKPYTLEKMGLAVKTELKTC